MQYTLTQLGMAYRKAKVDLYYSSHPSLVQLAEYENDLEGNLTRLQQKLAASDAAWFLSDEFVGSHVSAPKSIDPPKSVVSMPGTFVNANRHERWEHAVSTATKASEKHLAHFRTMERCSIDLHVIASLWIHRVGQYFDSLLTDRAYGSRLRRRGDGTLNELALGNMERYIHPYRKWRDDAIRAMWTSLNSDDTVR